MMSLEFWSEPKETEPCFDELDSRPSWFIENSHPMSKVLDSRTTSLTVGNSEVFIKDLIFTPSLKCSMLLVLSILRPNGCSRPEESWLVASSKEKQH